MPGSALLCKDAVGEGRPPTATHIAACWVRCVTAASHPEIHTVAVRSIAANRAACQQAITGAGMLAIPRAFVQVGWLAGTAMLLLVGLLSWLTMVVLVRGASQHGCSTYAGLVATVFQHRSRRTKLMFLPLQLSIVGFCLGFSVVHLVTVRDVLVDLLREVCGAAASAAGPLIRQVATGAIEPRPFDPRLLIIAVAACVCAPALLTIR